MSINAKPLLLVLAGLLVGMAAVQAQDAFVQGAKPTGSIKVTSCVVLDQKSVV